jgi:hypothetical protein
MAVSGYSFHYCVYETCRPMQDSNGTPKLKGVRRGRRRWVEGVKNLERILNSALKSSPTFLLKGLTLNLKRNFTYSHCKKNASFVF